MALGVEGPAVDQYSEWLEVRTKDRQPGLESHLYP